jgi:hypothetical protein
MQRAHIGLMLALVMAVPAAAGGAFFTSDFTSGGKFAAAKPCFVAGNAGYLLSANASAAHIVRIDNTAAHPDVRMQLVDDPAAADFVLVDDSDASPACQGVSMIESIHIDAAAAKPDLTIALSRDPADYKIYLHSDHYTEQDVAALAAVIRQKAGGRGSLRTATR